jgi:hypothetical protein
VTNEWEHHLNGCRLCCFDQRRNLTLQLTKCICTWKIIVARNLSILEQYNKYNSIFISSLKKLWIGF